jgi:hypothetical protein
LVATGCATPPPVHELADKTSANVGIVSARLRQLADESNRLYASRADNIARLDGANATARANLAYDIALTRKVGQQADVDLIKDIQAWMAEIDQIAAGAADAEKQRRGALLASQAKIDAKSQALQKVAETLAALAKEESVAERVKLLQKFAVEVRDDMKKELDDGSVAATRAKALLEHVRATLAPASPN